MPIMFETSQVVGVGNRSFLVCESFHLPSPAEEIKDIRKTVIIDSCKVIFDQVIIDGRLRKNIIFKHARHGFALPGTIRACSGITDCIPGTLQDLDVEIAFNTSIPVTGALPTDRCVVLQAFVQGEVEEPANICDNGTFMALIDKSQIFICVKVVREVVTTGVTGAGGTPTPSATALCPTPRSTGFFPGGQGTIPAATPGPLPGTFVGPTLIFPGVLNPGIPTRFPTANHLIGGTELCFPKEDHHEDP